MSAPVKLRLAEMCEAGALGALAFRSKAHWGYSPEFMRACRAELEVPPEQIAAGRVSVVETDDMLAGFYAVEPLDAKRYDLTHLFVDPCYLRRGIGARLLHAALQHVARANGEILEVQSDPNAAGFYASHGGQRAGDMASLSIASRTLPCFRFVCAPM